MSAPLQQLQTAFGDRYHLEQEIGEGGMATVYLARDLKHDRQVAIKVLRPDIGAALGADRFLLEIKTTANLRHPHILPLYDSGEVTLPPRAVGEAAQVTANSLRLSHQAIVYAQIGAVDSAFSRLQLAVRTKDPTLYGVINSLEFAPLHKDPRWGALMQAYRGRQ